MKITVEIGYTVKSGDGYYKTRTEVQLAPQDIIVRGLNKVEASEVLDKCKKHGHTLDEGIAISSETCLKVIHGLSQELIDENLDNLSDMMDIGE